MHSLRIAILLIVVTPTWALSADDKILSPSEAKAAFLKLLDRPKVPLDVKADEPIHEVNEKRLIEHLTFASEKKSDGTVERVPVLIVRPVPAPGADKPRPAVIVLHGTGGTKDGMRKWLNDFADRGIIAVAIDARYHGERVGVKKGSEAYANAITKAWRTPKGEAHEHPWFYDTCWDLWRLLDYLESRPDVDKKRIGMTGTSMGGIQTTFAASVDDRVAVAAPLIGVQSFRYGLENDLWQARANTIKSTHEAVAKDMNEPKVNRKVCETLWAKVVPGITREFDFPNLMPLFAGRPLFIGNGELDPNCPLKGAEIAFEAARESFAKANAKEKLQIVVDNGVAHKVTPEMHKATVDFCVKWLTK